MRLIRDIANRLVAIRIGKRLKAVRKSWGFTRKAVSEFLGDYPMELLKAHESGKLIISVSKLAALAEIYGTDFEYLLLGEGTAPKGLDKQAREGLDKVTMKALMFANRVVGAFNECLQMQEGKEG